MSFIDINWESKELEPYKKAISKKKNYLRIRRFFDVLFSLILLVLFSPLLLIISICVYIEDFDSPLFLQERITKDGEVFRMIKFRSMRKHSAGELITQKNDSRITKIGVIIRKYRIDEIPQLINILKGDMTFVGVRPEVPHYVKQYTEEMYATLLLPAGVTSLASVLYKDEDKILGESNNAENVYLSSILPQKMKYNLEYTLEFSWQTDIKIIIKTIKGVFF